MLLENNVSSYLNEEMMEAYENQLNLTESNNNIIDIINTNEVTRTPIQDFYADQNIFVTGATGFLGKTMIEKLLRSCPEVSTIYVLIRPKNQTDINDRIEEIFNEPIFEQLKKDQPKFRHKIVGISGDCSLPDLGLSANDRKILNEEVTVVFHSAATVKFNEKLRISTAINAGGTLSMINLCKEMKKLKVMIHVSTAYANCHIDTIDERFYSHPYKYNQLTTIVNSLPDEAVNSILPKILDKWPNTYTFTKALAEQLIRENCQGMTVGIFRPAIVISCAEEPLPGWIDNFYGPTGVAAASTAGMMKFVCVDPTVEANVVPVDYTVNALLASACDVVQRSKRSNSTEDLLIYNYVSSIQNPIKWNEYLSVCLHYGREFPIQQSVWYLTVHLSKHKIIKFFAIIFLHLLPALLLDTVSICSGQKPRMLKAVRKIHRFMDVIEPFCVRSWRFTNDNVQEMWQRLDPKDKDKFKFCLTNLEWKSYLRSHMIGVKRYLFKEDLTNLDAAKRRLKKLRVVHETLKVVILLIIVAIIWKIYRIIF